MNRIYRLVWSRVLGTWVVACESARGRGKGSGRSLVAAALTVSAVTAQAGPSGGQVTSGAANITQSGATTTVQQATPTVSVNWQSFNTSSGETVNFIQPTASAIAVNRISGTSGTQFFGKLNANGQVYLINPNGILFGRTAQVNVGGLVASTLDLSDASLQSGTRTFSGASTAQVVNEGSIQGRYVALLGSSVINRGSIRSDAGAVALGAGSTVTLAFADNDLVKVTIDRSMLETLAENGGLIQADGGRVFLSAGAKDSLLASVVNNTGVIEARTVENREGAIVLLGGMAGAGQVNVGGTLDASAPAGANGGFIETSAAHVKVADDVHVTTLAGAGGRHGTWLIDPVDFTIAAQGGDLTGAVLSAQLGGGNITILSTSGAAGVNGDIHVNDAVSWSADTTLQLSAVRNININKSITASGNAAGLVLTPNNTGTGTGDYVMGAGAKVTLSGSAPTLTIGGTAYTVINNNAGAGAATLQNVGANLAGQYALGDDIDLASISNFTPIGPTFTGTLAGMGHHVDNLTITSVASGYAGLISTNSGTVRDLSLVNVAVAPGTTATYTGGLAGTNTARIADVAVSGTVTTSNNSVGGVVGMNDAAGSLTRTHADVAVTGGSAGYNAGGLVGVNNGALTDVYATGAVNGWTEVGGLVGYHTGTMTRAYATGAVSGTGSYVGGLVGYTSDYAVASSVYATGSVTGSSYVGGLVGYNLGSVDSAYASGAVSGASNVGGLVGQNGYFYYYTYSCGRSTCSSSTSYPGYVTSAFWDTQTTGQSTAGYTQNGYITATGRTTAQSMAQANYTGWDFSNTWAIYEGSTRPLLRSFLKPLAVTANSDSKTYDGQAYANGNGVSYSEVPDANLLGTLAYAGTSQGAINAGSYSIRGTGLYSNQQGYLITYADGTLTVNAAPITVSSSNVTKTYDGTTSALGTAVVASGTLYGSDSLGGGSYAFTDKNAGSGNKTVTVAGVTVNDGNGGGNYLVSYVDNTTSTIDPALLTATMTAANKTYDGSRTAASTFTITGGLVGTETVTASAAASFADKNAGTGKTVTASSVLLANGANGGLASNYTLAAGQTALADITPKAASVSGITASDKVYDGSTTATVNTAGAVVSGLVAGDAVTVGATGTFSDKNVGTAKTVTLVGSYGGADAGNYTIAGPSSTTASITPAALSVSGITAADKVYDGNVTASVGTAGAVLGGLVAGDAVTVGATGTFSDKNVGTAKAVTLASTYGGADLGNYTITGQGSTSASITPATLSVSGITAADKVYDGNVTASVNMAGAVLGGLVAGDTVTVGATGTFANKNAGSAKTVTLASTYGGADLGNYTVAGQATTTASITPAALSVSGITAADKVYDGNVTATVNTAGAALGGLVAGDAVTVTATGTFSDKNMGTAKAVSLASSYGGADIGNYTITGQSGTTASITPAALSVSGITAADKVYDGNVTAAVNTAGAVLAGLVAGDVVAVGATGTFSDKNVGTAKTVTLASTYGGADLGNYTIVGQGSTTASITPAALAVTGLTAADKVYDGNTAATVNTAGVVLGGLVAGDAVTVAAMGTFADKNVGTAKTVSLASSYGGADAANYTITGQATTTASITPAPLLVTANSDARVLDGVPYGGGNGVTYSGFVPGDSAAVLAGSLAFGGSSQGATAAGSYAIRPSGLLASNYTLSFADGLLTIGQAPGSTQSALAARTQAQALLQDSEPESAGTLRLLNCNGKGAAGSDVICSAAQRPDGPLDTRAEAARTTLRIVDGGIKLP